MLSLNTLLSVACAITAGGIAYVGHSASRIIEEATEAGPVRGSENWSIIEPGAGIVDAVPETIAPQARPEPEVVTLQVFGPAADSGDPELTEALDRWHVLQARTQTGTLERSLMYEGPISAAPEPEPGHVKRSHARPQPRSRRTGGNGHQARSMYDRSRFKDIKFERYKERQLRRDHRTPLSRIQSRIRAGSRLRTKEQYSVYSKSRQFKKNGSVFDRINRRRGRTYMKQLFR